MRVLVGCSVNDCLRVEDDYVCPEPLPDQSLSCRRTYYNNALKLCEVIIMAEEYDLVIRNSLIVDGTDNPWFKDDIAIKNRKIVRVGKVEGRGEVELDARSLVVSPDFIDLHNHSDLTILAYPNAESY